MSVQPDVIQAHTTESLWRGPVMRKLLAPGTLISVGIIVVLAGLVINPLAHLLYESIRLEGGGATWAHYVDAFSRPRYVQAYINSIKLGAITACLAALIAVPLAWGVSRTSMPGREFVHLTVIISFLIPPFVGAIGWILLGGPNAGWLNRLWSMLTGADTGPINIFSFTGFAFVVALYTFPLIYILTKSMLDLISSELEEAASILGAGPIKTTFLITLPLALPAILGSTLLVFLEVLGLYGTAALIGIPAGYNVITTQLAEFFQFPLRTEVAAAFSMPLVGITIVMLGIQRLLLRRKRFTIVTGKPGGRSELPIGKLGWVLLAYAMLIALLSTALPIFTIFQGAFSKAWSHGLSVDNFTLENVRQALFVQQSIRESLFNTLSYAFITATGCTVLGFTIAYIVKRQLIPYAGGLSAVTLAPFAIPGIVLATSFYAAYAAAPFALYGTGMIIVIAFMARTLPISFVSSRSAIEGLHPELEEAVRISGGTPRQSLRHVVLPILKKSLFGGWLLIFVISSRELSTAMFLTGPNTRVLSILTIEMSEEGQFELLSATALLLLVVTAVVCLIGSRLLGRDFMLRRN